MTDNQRPAAVTATSGPGCLRTCLARDPNTLDSQLIAELWSAIMTAESDLHCRVLVIDHADKTPFCIGMPLHPDNRLPDGWAAAPQSPPWQLFRKLADSPVVTVAVVDGPAIGGGVALAAACDLVVAGADASFRLTELLIGLVPAIAFPFIADRTGPHAAVRLALTCAEVGPDAAVQLGLADFADTDTEPLVRRISAGLRRLDRDAVAALKSYRRLAFPQPSGLASAAQSLLVQRMNAPSVIERLNSLHREGLLG